MGQMADLTAANPKEETLITTEISKFVHISTLIGVGMGLFCFVVAFLLGYYWIDAILFFIGVIVANVPESLLVVFTISLSISATRLSKRFVHIMYCSGQFLIKNIKHCLFHSGGIGT